MEEKKQIEILDRKWWSQYWKKIVAGMLIWTVVVFLILYSSGHFESETILAVFGFPIFWIGFMLIVVGATAITRKLFSPFSKEIESFSQILGGVFGVVIKVGFLFIVLFAVVKLIKWIWYF